MSIRVVIDTNVLISAILVPGSNPDKVMQLARSNFIQVISSPEILEKLEHTLRKKIKYPERQVKDFMIWVENLVKVISPVHTVSKICEKETDHRIIECALSGGARFIISGDKKHLLCLKKYKDIEIVSPAGFLERVLG